MASSVANYILQSARPAYLPKVVGYAMQMASIFLPGLLQEARATAAFIVSVVANSASLPH